MKFAFPPESRPLEGYTIKRGIRRGGFGEVYYALSDAGKEVALKLLQQNLEVELRGVSQCLNLKHPNLVTIFDIRTDEEGDYWIVMEYVAGQSLDQVLAESPNGLPMEQVERWLSGICAGVGFLHDRGIVHRDLKPGNILQEGNIVKTGDVGLSKFISPSRRSAHTQSVGTVYYMAPEVARGRYGKEVDVYALGIILHEMLTGHVLFDGETTAEILMKHLSEPPDLSAIPERLRPVLANALQKEPDKRTASVAELERQFKKAVRGGTVPVTVVESPNNAKKTATAKEESPRSHAAPQANKSYRSVSARNQTSTANQAEETPWYQHPAAVIAGIVLLLLLVRVSPGGVTRLFLTAFTLAIWTALVYGVYRLVRFCFQSSSPWIEENDSDERSSPSHKKASQMRRAAGTHRARPLASRVRQHPAYSRYGQHVVTTPETRRYISMRQRVADMTGAMAFGSLCTAVITAGVYWLSSLLCDPGTTGLFALVTLLGSWAVIVPSKLWEGTTMDKTLRRLVQLGMGCTVGVASYFVNQMLYVDLFRSNGGNPFGIFTYLGIHPLHTMAAQPTLACFIAFFGTLFLLRRWWWQADAFRSKRLSVGSLLWTAIVAFVAATLWGFPSTWATTWAVAISSVVQLSSAWHAPEDRYANIGSHRNVSDP